MSVKDCGFCNELLNCGARLSKADADTVLAKLLCELVDKTPDGAGGDPTPVIVGTAQAQRPALAQVAFGSITNAFVVALNDTNPKVYVNLYNNTNGTILVSFDGVTVHEILTPSTAVVQNLGDFGRHESGKVWIKYSVQPTAGEFNISAIY